MRSSGARCTSARSSTALALFAGLELYGFTGALLLLLAMIIGVAIVAEIGPEEVSETLLAPLAGVDQTE